MRKHDASRGEIEAWKQLRMLRAEGFAFRREQQIGRYRADFVCLRRRLIVEVDGPLHETAEAQKHDAKRDAWLISEGFRVLRFKEAVILSGAYWIDEIRTVLTSQREFEYRRRVSPLPPPPLPLGEGEST